MGRTMERSSTPLGGATLFRGASQMVDLASIQTTAYEPQPGEYVERCPNCGGTNLSEGRPPGAPYDYLVCGDCEWGAAVDRNTGVIAGLGTKDRWYAVGPDVVEHFPQFASRTALLTAKGRSQAGAGLLGPDGRPMRLRAMEGRLVVAYDEQPAPPKVDTLRGEACPVCGEKDNYTGDECGVCGFHKPPDAYMDPDVEKAKQVDLRQDATEEVEAQAGADLVCDNCGDHFGGGGGPTASPASAGGGLEKFRV